MPRYKAFKMATKVATSINKMATKLATMKGVSRYDQESD